MEEAGVLAAQAGAGEAVRVEACGYLGKSFPSRGRSRSWGRGCGGSWGRGQEDPRGGWWEVRSQVGAALRPGADCWSSMTLAAS